MALARSRQIITSQISDSWLNLSHASDMFNDNRWYLANWHKISQTLKNLQKNQESQLGKRPTGHLFSQGQLIQIRRINNGQIANGNMVFESRVCGFLNRWQG